MFDVARPKITEAEVRETGEGRMTGKYIIEPLERGYGTTLGAVLRRTLLSSLPGTAISYIKVEGISHEFMPLYGMQEEVSEFIANLKKVNIKNSEKSDRYKYGYLKVSGKGVVTAGDIQLGDILTVTNPDLVLAHLGKDDAVINAEFIMTDGYGYRPAETESEFANYIAIDSLYSPILNVIPKVESSRVGHDTNYDRLILEMETDGTVLPKNALSMAGAIIADQMKIFADYTGEGEYQSPFMEKAVENDESVMEQPIDVLGLSLRTYNALKNADVETVGLLSGYDRASLLKIKNIGDKAADEITEKLAKFMQDSRG